MNISFNSLWFVKHVMYTVEHHKYVPMPKVEWIQQQMVQKRVKRTDTMDQTHATSFNDPKWDSMWYIVSMQHITISYFIFR